MMAPDYAHWHGMFEVAERFYKHLIPETRELCKRASENSQNDQATVVLKVVDDILASPNMPSTKPIQSNRSTNRILNAFCVFQRPRRPPPFALCRCNQQARKITEVS